MNNDDDDDDDEDEDEDDDDDDGGGGGGGGDGGGGGWWGGCVLWTLAFNWRIEYIQDLPGAARRLLDSERFEGVPVSSF